MENTEINPIGIQSENKYSGTSPLPKNAAVTMAYVPFQTDTTQYTPEMALSEGTLFPNLNKPFLGGKCK